MKRITVSLLVLMFLLMLVMPVMAAPDGPKITMQPQNYQYPEYSVAIYTVKATGTNLHATWYLEYEGKTYNLSDNQNGVEPWEGYAGETYGPVQDGDTFSWFFGGIEEGLNGAEIWCVLEDGHYDVTSARAMITVQGDAMPPEILDMPAELTVLRGEEAEARCVARSNSDAQLAFQWYETSTGKLQDIRALDGEDSDYMFCSTEVPGTRYYVCCVTTTAGGRAYSSVLPVTVLDSDPQPELTILTDTLPSAVAGQPYEASILCSDPDAEIALYHDPGNSNDFEKIGGLTLGKDGKITGTPTNPGKYSFAISAAGASGEDYMRYTLEVADSPAETTPTTQPTAGTEAPTVKEPSTATTPTAVETVGSLPTKEESTGISPWVLVAVGVAAVAVGACVAVLVMKKK